MKRTALTCALASAAAAAVLLALGWVSAARAEAQAHDPSADDRYSLAGGCFALRSEQTGDFVVKAGGGYAATAATAGAAEPFRMQATDLGSYLFYGEAEDFLARNALLNSVEAAAQPSDDSDWTVTEDGGAFRVVNEFANRDLAVGTGDALTTVAQGSGGAAGLFSFEETTGCADYPEIEVNVTGPMPPTNPPNSQVTGFVETHMHQMAFEFLGTKAHCGRPWHRFGAPFALVDCPDHEPNGCTAVLETALSGSHCHNTDGWPTFTGWPHHSHYTHEQSYYKWLERSWRSGLRVFVNLLVENRVLCELYPLTPPDHNCDEMVTVRREAQRMRELERYIDAQNGGPGRGWYRIVESPAEAREVINDGKLAVVMGMEVSEPFGCRLMQPGNMSLCTEQELDAGIDEIYDLGVRQVELVNKFDNSLTGVAGDGAAVGTITNGGNFLSAGTFWDLEHCEDEVNHDHSPTAIPHNDDALIANGLDEFADLSGISPPVYGPPPHCNQRGLSALGERAVRRLIDKGMLFDPDHMSVIARNQALDLVEKHRYPGVMTSHSWSTDNAMPRISRLGGLIGPSTGDSESFVGKWLHFRSHGYDDMNPYGFGLGYGADMNGFAAQGGPRTTTPEHPPVSYPFPSPIQPGVTIHQQRSGTRVYDINADGVAHYGLYPDWIEDVRILGGPEIIDDMAGGAEAYLQMWERAAGTSVAGGSATLGVSTGTTDNSKRCKALRAKLKRSNSKQAKRKLRRKLRRLGC